MKIHFEKLHRKVEKNTWQIISKNVFHIDKKNNLPKVITLVRLYAPNNIALKYKDFIELLREIHKSFFIIMRDL